MPAVGLGRGSAHHVGGGIPLGAATWEDGFYVDFSRLSGTLSSSVTPDVGSVSLVPVGSPVIDPVGIGGRPAVFLDQASSQHFTAHALSALQAGSDLPLTFMIEVKRDWPLSRRSMFGFGNSAQSTNDYFDCGFPGGAGVSPNLQRDAIAEATKSITGATAVDYAPHIVWVDFDGSTGSVYIDDMDTPKATGSLDTLALTVNRFTLGARITTAAGEHLGGWIARAAMTGARISNAQAATVRDNWLSKRGAYPGLASGAPFQWFGDSITQGDSDTYATSSTRGGLRYRAYENWRTNNYRINSVGHRTQGIFADPEHSSIGGADTTLVRSYINTYIPTYTPRAVYVMTGTNDSDAIEDLTLPLATWSSNYTGMLADVRTRLDALGTGRNIVVANLLPIETGQPGATVIGTMNAELESIWDAHDAANPTAPPLIRCDMHTAIGGAWASGNYKDSVHPNAAGYDLMGTELNTQCAALWASLG